MWSFNFNFVPFDKEPRLCIAILQVETVLANLQYFLDHHIFVYISFYLSILKWFFRKVQSEKCLSTFCEIISKTGPPWTPASELHFLSPSRRWEPIPTPPLPCSSRWTPFPERKKNIETENGMWMSAGNGEHLVRPWLSSDLYIMPVVRGLW